MVVNWPQRAEMRPRDFNYLSLFAINGCCRLDDHTVGNRAQWCATRRRIYSHGGS